MILLLVQRNLNVKLLIGTLINILMMYVKCKSQTLELKDWNKKKNLFSKNLEMQMKSVHRMMFIPMNKNSKTNFPKKKTRGNKE